MSTVPDRFRDRIEVAKDEQLKELDLSNDQSEPLTRIPEKVFQLEQLEVLDLSGNAISFIPAELESLKNLKTLILNRNQLRTKSITTAKLVGLETLYLSNNNLELLPPFVAYLHNLRELDLSHNRLTEIPSSIGGLEQLRYFDISKNYLQTLPAAFGSLTHLQHLNLRNNRLTSLPETVYELRKLQYLYLGTDQDEGNQIKEISSRILEIEYLKFLDLAGNPLEIPPPEIVRKGVEAVKDYFRLLASEGTDHLFEAKLLIVGEGGAGKTTLAKKIIDPAYQLLNEDSTRGIDVFRWQFPLANGRTFQVNIWDFGGQEIYHATHQFFLTKRSVYVLVADTRSEDTDFYYWLNVAELLSDGSPILIIKNEKQDRHREIDERAFRAQFANLKDTLAANLATNRGLSRIIEEIRHQITQLPHVGALLPLTWVRVREALEQDPRNYIMLDEYFAICEANGFDELTSKLQLSGYLHDLGVCLHFQDDPLLKKTVILKPKWGTDAAYKVLDNLRVIRNLGRFSRADLTSIWNDPEHAGMHDELLQLMMKFKLCYPLPGVSETYIAPQLLSGNPPDYSWDDSDNLLLRYTYDFMPKGIVTQFIVAMHSSILDQLVWRTGVILSSEGALAEVREYYAHREIRIRVAGKDSRRLLVIVSHELDKIHASYPRLRCTRLVPCSCASCCGKPEPHFYRLDVLRRFFEDRQVHIQCQKSYGMVNVRGLMDDVASRDQPTPGAQSTRNVREGRARPVSSLEGTVENRYSYGGDSSSDQSKAEVKAEARGVGGARSAWASGSFYLFAFVTVLAAIGVLAKTVPGFVFPIVLAAGAIFVPLIGALQLRMDDHLPQKSFLDLMKIAIGQLPLINRMANKKDSENVHPDE